MQKREEIAAPDPQSCASLVHLWGQTRIPHRFGDDRRWGKMRNLGLKPRNTNAQNILTQRRKDAETQPKRMEDGKTQRRFARAQNLREFQQLSVPSVPKGPDENSPALQRRDPMCISTSPAGTA